MKWKLSLSNIYNENHLNPESMNKLKTGSLGDFSQIASMIDESRKRAFHKVNEELVLLYFKIGGIVSRKVADKTWGDS